MAAAKKKGGGKRKPPAKKAAKKRGPAKRPPVKKPATKKARKKAPKKKAKAAKGPRLTAAQQHLRDTLMVVRVDGQGWSIEEAATEAGIKVEAAKLAIKKKREAQVQLLDKDPVEIIEGLVVQWQMAIGDFEQIAAAAAEANNLPVAVGAKKGAGEAREKLTELLQSFGTLPHDLGTITYTVEIRAVAMKINGAIEDFVSAVKEMKLPKKFREPIELAAGQTIAQIDSIATKPQSVTPEEEENEDE